MWIMKIPVLTTEHLKPETMNWLSWTEDILVAQYDAGVFMHVDDEATPANCPVDLVTIMDWARENQFN